MDCIKGSCAAKVWASVGILAWSRWTLVACLAWPVGCLAAPAAAVGQQSVTTSRRPDDFWDTSNRSDSIGAVPAASLVSLEPSGSIRPEGCAPSDDCDGAYSGTRLFDNVSGFIGLDGAKQPQDFGINAQFGGRASVNWGIPLIKSLGIGAQLGTAIDATGDAVQVVQRIQGSTGRTQSYTTVGLFQHSDSGLFWGAAYDFLYENYYDSFRLSQWRLNLGYQVSERNTVGVWSAISGRNDAGHFGGIPITLVPITQTNIYWKHTCLSGVQLAGWGGLANSHGQVNAVLGDLPRLHDPFVFGAELFVPLSERWAIVGQGNFIMPASSGTVDAYLGFAFYPHGGIRQLSSAFAPVQSVAAPTNFAVDLKR
jgi:hypothetical protein